MSKKIELTEKINKLTSHQLLIYQDQKRSTSAFLLLTLFLGGLGIQWFYTKQPILGVISIILCWTFIPAILSLPILCCSSIIVRNYNFKLADRVALYYN